MLPVVLFSLTTGLVGPATGASASAPDAGAEQWSKLQVDGPDVDSGFGPMVYDASRQQVVLYADGFRQPVGFGDSSTWVWNGSTWTDLGIASPDGRASPAMAYDEANQEIVLFGGSGIEAEPHNDTWVFKNGTWKQVHPAVSPAPRREAAMTYDPLTPRVLLFGGESIHAGVFADTWAWDGTNWTQLQPVDSPRARYGSQMVYDANLSSVVMFGGFVGAGRHGVSAQTWAWNGSTWDRLTDVGKPRARHSFGMATVDGNAVISGGDNFYRTLRDTWILRDTGWQRVAGNHPRQPYGDLAWDPVRDEAVRLGFSGFDQPRQTWTLSG
jgi:hypothetical protein